MDIVKIAFAAILTALLYALIKQIKPEMAPLVLLGGVAVILLAAAESFLDVSGKVGEIMSLAGLNGEYAAVLIKVLGICVVTQFAADICRDNSGASIASAVELAGRIAAVTLAMPMLQTVAGLALGLIT